MFSRISTVSFVCLMFIVFGGVHDALTVEPDNFRFKDDVLRPDPRERADDGEEERRAKRHCLRISECTPGFKGPGF